MTQDVRTIFTEVETRAKRLVQAWETFRVDMEQYLPEDYHPEIQALSRKLESQLQTLLDELSQPTLTLATTGTTSGGKSSLVNFLCGAEIMPVAVSEMSAGVVTIEYGPETVLVIPKTPDATWEWGEWQGLKDSEIQRRLHDVMLAFIDGRKERPDLACPQFYIRYPFRLHSLLELPSSTKIRILDLPGLASMGDEGNREIITSQAGQSLCLVTYNSAETDQQKINKLLSEVVGEVKKLGGSPARMLFILNRIDVFRTDNTWPASEKRATTQTVDSIKSQLKESLVEYKEEIEALKVVKLSTLPALFSLQIRSAETEISNQACTRAEKDFSRLIGDDILKDLPRNQERWQAYDRQRVAQRLWLNSYGSQFDETLRKHVEENFPQLVLPQLITKFKEEGANAAIEWVQQTVQAVLNSFHDKYEQEVRRLYQIRYAIDQFLEESARELKRPFEDLVETGASGADISDAVVFTKNLED
ncbi:MAG: dynamin family protein [Phormidium sp. PBR-2020]|nr:MAG: dynamin family protein [Phormidium sp. PBR-2020]